MSSGVRRSSRVLILGPLGLSLLAPTAAGAASSTSTTRTTRSTTTTRPALPVSGVSVTTPAAAVPYGRAVPITVQVSCAAGATGTATLELKGRTVGTATLAAGRATFSLPQLSGGAHVVTAQYAGSTRCAAGESRATAFTVSPGSTTMTLKADEPTPVRGQPVTVTATFTRAATNAAYPTGSVTLYDGGTALVSVPVDVSGTAAGTLEDLDAGVHEIHAVYDGDANYTDAEAKLTATVTPADTEVTASSLDRSNTEGEETVLDVTVEAVEPAVGVPAGTVELRVAGAVLARGKLDDAGRAHLRTTALGRGTNELVAVYVGNDQYHGAAAEPVTVEVRKSEVTPAPRPGPPAPPARGSNSRGVLVLLVLAAGAIAAGATAGRQLVRTLAARRAAGDPALVDALAREGVADLDPEGPEAVREAAGSDEAGTPAVPAATSEPELAILDDADRAALAALVTEVPPVQVSDPLDAEILSYLSHGPSVEMVEALDPGDLSLDEALAQLPDAAGDPALAAMLKGAFAPLGPDPEAAGRLPEPPDGEVGPSS